MSRSASAARPSGRCRSRDRPHGRSALGPALRDRLEQKLRHAIVELVDQRLVEALRHTGRTAPRRRRRAARRKPARVPISSSFSAGAGAIVRVEFQRHAPGFAPPARSRRPPRASRPCRNQPSAQPGASSSAPSISSAAGGMVAGAEQHLGIVVAAVGQQVAGGSSAAVSSGASIGRSIASRL